MENYKLAEKQKYDLDRRDDKIIITSSGKVNNYVNVALKKLDNTPTIELFGTGNATTKVISVSEVLGRRSKKKLDKHIEVGALEARDLWEPIDEKSGLDKIVVTKKLPFVKISIGRIDDN